jgi:hypothetical protein
MVAGRPDARSDVDPPGVAVGVGLAVFVQPDKAATIAIISVIVKMTDIFLICMTHTLLINPLTGNLSIYLLPIKGYVIALD